MRLSFRALLGAGIGLLALSPTSATYAAPLRAHAWADGHVVTFFEVSESSSAAGPAQSGEYVIAPVDAAHPLFPGGDEVGDIDLVVTAPRDNRGSYTSHLRVYLVLPSDGAPAGDVAYRRVRLGDDTLALAYGANLGSGIVPLNSIGRIYQAGALGLVDIIDTGLVEVCHVIGRR